VLKLLLLCRVYSFVLDWTMKAAFSTCAQVLKQRHFDSYLRFQNEYLLRVKLALSAAPAGSVVEPFSSFDDKAGYCGSGAFARFRIAVLTGL
jgi:hypothetical protein